MILEQIKNTNDVKKIDREDLPLLAEEIRSFLIDTLSHTGGHLASNLGAVELTIALHRVFDVEKDRIIWDVGHQSYTHKILTGRGEKFDTLRSYGGISGFPRIDESPADAFGTGHASTSISAGLGIATARDIVGEDFDVVSVIGDGSITGGMVYEAMNNASNLKTNFIIVLNDNNMSISLNVGGMHDHLIRVRTSRGYVQLKEGVQSALEKIPLIGHALVRGIRKVKNGIKQLLIPGMIFEDLGIMYIGPVRGHNIEDMERAFRRAREFHGPVLVHVITEKGRGFLPAQRHPSRFHGADPFDPERGLPLVSKKPSYTDIFSTVMRKMGDRDPKVVAVTAAMMDGTGLKRFHNMFPDRFFDVGIAEEHAVTFAAGMATRGLVPVVAIYSSFLQRAYDQVLHDVALQKLHVVFAVDRAGLVGSDGATHQGVFDLSYLTTIPNLVVMAPKNKYELSDMVKWAVSYESGPVAIRYPRGEACINYKEYRAPIELGRSEPIKAGGKVLLYAIGSMVDVAMKVKKLLSAEGIKVAVCNARFAAPLDEAYLKEAADRYDMVFTMEENVRSGGFGEHVTDHLLSLGYKGRIEIISIPDEFVEHGNVALLKQRLGLDAESLALRIKKEVKSGRK